MLRLIIFKKLISDIGNKLHLVTRFIYCINSISCHILYMIYIILYTVHPPICHTPQFIPKTQFIPIFFGHENVTNRVRGGFQKKNV